MKKFLPVIILAILFYGFNYVKDHGFTIPENPSTSQGADAILLHAFQNRQSDIQVQGQGTVVKVLRDDLDGSRHQKFLLRLASGQTVLVSHNIDLAPRVSGLAAGDTVDFYGEYEWNDKGGVIHWTHHDPAGRHVGGWLKHNGNTFQ